MISEMPYARKYFSILIEVINVSDSHDVHDIKLHVIRITWMKNKPDSRVHCPRIPIKTHNDRINVF